MLTPWHAGSLRSTSADCCFEGRRGIRVLPRSCRGLYDGLHLVLGLALVGNVRDGTRGGEQAPKVAGPSMVARSELSTPKEKGKFRCTVARATCYTLAGRGDVEGGITGIDSISASSSRGLVAW